MGKAPVSIGFLGAGRMATAIASGFVRENSNASILAFDPDPAARDRFLARIPNVRFVAETKLLAIGVQLLVLAVKPQMARVATQDLGLTDRGPLVLSVMAGIKISQLCEWLGTNRIVRAMPNTPCLIGEGAIGMASPAEVSTSEREIVQQLLATVGLVIEVNENQLDAVTGLSGSGPAFVFSFLRALIDGGVQAGLTCDVARQLAIKTVIGSSRLLMQEGVDPQVLIERVASPGGTTLCGLEVLRQREFESIVVDCVLAATNRAAELSKLA